MTRINVAVGELVASTGEKKSDDADDDDHVDDDDMMVMLKMTIMTTTTMLIIMMMIANIARTSIASYFSAGRVKNGNVLFVFYQFKFTFLN